MLVLVLALIGCAGPAGDGACFSDADADGYGVGEALPCAAGLAARGGDCDDDDAAVHPAAEEACNGADDDCDGEADDGLAVTWYLDEDGDGFGQEARVLSVGCHAPALGAAATGDCDDRDPAVNPGAPEACNLLDDDCDGDVDEDAGPRWYVDADGDGYGDATDPGTPACEAPADRVADGGDCDDADINVSPAAAETCDGRDEDCDLAVDDGTGPRWYADADGDGYGDPAAPRDACEQPVGHVADGTDCDDADARVHPGAAEADCDDRTDYNCDGSVGRADADDDGWAACEECADDDGARSPDATETCNTVDDDCDGVVDEDDAADALTWYLDADGDGYGGDWDPTWACAQPAGYAPSADDCDDADAATNPGAPEVCDDGVDNDCDDTRSGCGIWGDMALGEADAILRGEALGDMAGYWVAGAGDLDGDGLDDLAIGAMKSDRMGLDSGAVYLVSGHTKGEASLSTAAGILDAEWLGDRLGSALGPVGDLDGDGYGELLVGAYRESATDEGAAYLVYGPPSGTVSVASAHAKLVGEDVGDYTGFSVAAPGDVDGDGVADLLVGSRNHTDGAGAAYVVSADVSGTLDLGGADARLEGVGSDHAAVVAAIGDVDGDGLADIGVGAYGHDEPAEDAGAAYVVCAPAAGVWSMEDATAVYEGEAAVDSAGMGLAAAGDVDGDGYDDFVIGAPFEASVNEGNGAAYLVRGPPAGDTSLGDAWLKLTGIADYGAAGRAVAGGHDADGDGWLDLLVGAYYGVTSDLEGTTYLVRGPFPSGELSLGDADAAMVGEAVDDHAGFSVSFAEVNGDGFADVLIGAYNNDVAATSAGAAYLLLGGDE